jgi:RHS repeat-associated protein
MRAISALLASTQSQDTEGQPFTIRKTRGPEREPIAFSPTVSCTGQEKDKETASLSDPTGEMHYRARAYSPRQMRFVQLDPPIDRRANHYSYVSNRPVSITDASGMAPVQSLKEILPYSSSSTVRKGWRF